MCDAAGSVPDEWCQDEVPRRPQAGEAYAHAGAPQETTGVRECAPTFFVQRRGMLNRRTAYILQDRPEAAPEAEASIGTGSR